MPKRDRKLSDEEEEEEFWENVDEEYEEAHPEETEQEDIEEEDDTDPELKARIRESGIRDQKQRILAKIEKRLDEDESTDALIRFIESNPELKTLVEGYVSLVLSFPKYPNVAKVVLSMTREGQNVHFGYKMTDAKGKDVMFNDKGEVVKVE
jgi:hypothetical protein